MKQPNKFYPDTRIESSSILHTDTEIKSIWTNQTKTKSISVLTFIPSDFRPAYKNQVLFDNRTKNKSIDPHGKNKSLSGRTQKRNIFLTPHKKQMNFNHPRRPSQFRYRL